MVLSDKGRVNKAGFAVEGRNVVFYHGSKKQSPALNGVDITVEKGVIYGLLGPSGCGKTTLLRCIIGRLKPKEGFIKVYGRVPGETGFCIPGRGVGYMPQELALYPEITIEETLTYFGNLYLMDSQYLAERIYFFLNFLEMPSKNILVKNLSGGEKRRVSFAAALIHRPPLLILDEPTVGVDPLLRHSIWEHLNFLASNNQMTIMITTHYVEEARQAQMVGLMRNGHLLAEMNPETLILRHGVQNLEDVFWKLCRKETCSEEESGYASTSPLGDSGSVPDQDVWISRKDMRRIQRSVDVESSEYAAENGSNHSNAVALLHDDDASEVNRIHHAPKFLARCRESQMRMGTLIAKSFIRLKRNIPFAFFQIFVPAFQVIVFCLCIGREPFDLPIAVVNLEQDSFGVSKMFLSKLSNQTFKQESYTNMSLALESVKNGETWGVMYIGPRFTSALFDRFMEGSNVDNETIDASEVKLTLDMTNQQIAVTIFAGIIKSFQAFSKEILIDAYQNPRLAEAPVVMEKPVYGKLDPNFTEFMAPGMILGITYIMAVGLTAMSIIIERKEGLLDRSWVAGVSAGEVVFSILFNLLIMMIAQIALVLIFTFFVFDLPVHGPVFWVIVCVMLSGTSGMAYGLLISSICSEENIAMMVAMGSFYPTLLLSGIIWPIEAMDYYLRYISYCLPLTLVANTMRSVMSRGWDITEHNIWIGCVVGVAWTVILILIASVIFKIKK